MRNLLIVLITSLVIGCAATTAKYSACLGFCVEASIDKEQAPEHVSETIRKITNGN